MKKTGAGYDGWASVSGGLTGTTYNGDEFAESFGWCNSRATGMIVRMGRVQFGANVEYWFNAWNLS
ncbi:MAG: hypothetical protein NTX87_07365 [Planctomycetota bacterium]|nr:hypothetical protein [Planctomycetota bacterium]